MLIFWGILSCAPRTIEVTHEVHLESEPESSTETIVPCSISLVPHLEDESAFVQVLVSGVDRITMQLSMYEGQEKLVRSLELDSSSTYDLEMFWPMETPDHSWQRIHGTQAQLLVEGYSEQGTSCSEQYVDDFIHLCTYLKLIALFMTPIPFPEQF